MVIPKLVQQGSRLYLETTFTPTGKTLNMDIDAIISSCLQNNEKQMKQIDKSKSADKHSQKSVKLPKTKKTDKNTKYRL